MLNLYVKLSMLRALAADRASQDRGATAVEYGVMVALIIAVVIAVVATIGQEILTAFETVRDALQ
jgi:pilus assembly protein Flp/PilA